MFLENMSTVIIFQSKEKKKVKKVKIFLLYLLRLQVLVKPN